MTSISSGTFSHGGVIDIDYSYSQDISNNTSTITATVYVHRDGYGPSWSDNCSCYLNINGSRAMTYTGSFSVGSSWVKIGPTVSITVPHNSDGTKVCNFYAAFSSNTAITGLSVESSEALDTIPRASQATLSSSDFYFGDNITVYTNRKSSAFTHMLTLSFGGYGPTLATDVADSWTFNTMDYASAMCGKIQSAKAGLGAITVDTYSGGNLIGSTKAHFVVRVPSSFGPAFSSFSWQATDNFTQALTGSKTKPIQNESQVQVNVSGASAQYSASIANYSVKYGSKTVSSSSSTISVGTLPNNDTLQVTVTDSRGFTYSQSTDITVTPYAAPQILQFTANRVNNIEANTLLSFKFTVSQVTANHVTVAYKLDGEANKTGSGNWVLLNPTKAGNEFTISNVSIGNLRIDETFTLTIHINDYMTYYSYDLYIPTSQPLMSMRDTAIGINKIPQHANGLDVHGGIWVDEGLNVAGAINCSSFTSAPLISGNWSNENEGCWDATVTRIGNMCFVYGNIHGPAGLADGTVLMNVPDGFRPKRNSQFNIYNAENRYPIWLDVRPNGGIVYRNSQSVTLGATWLGLQLYYSIS